MVFPISGFYTLNPKLLQPQAGVASFRLLIVPLTETLVETLLATFMILYGELKGLFR